MRFQKTRSKRINRERTTAVTTAMQSRCAIFAPIRRPNADWAKTVVETPWGRATIEGVQLTQIHRDILDAIFTFYDLHMRADGSCVVIIPSLYQLQRRLGITATNHAWIRERLTDLTTVLLTVEVGGSPWAVQSHVVRKHAWHRDGCAYAVVFESDYMSFFARDVTVRRTPELTQSVLDLDDGVVQAMVRYVTSHTEVPHTLDEVLRFLGVGEHERVFRRARARVLGQAELLQERFGINIVKGEDGQHHIVYHQHAEVWFDTATKASVRTDNNRQTGPLIIGKPANSDR